MKNLSVEYKIPTTARKTVADLIKPFISESRNSQYKREQITDVLIATSLMHESLEATAKEPIGDTVFLRIVRSYKKLRKLIRKARPKIDKEIDIAIDVHDEMYHGEKKRGIIGTKPKNGSHFAFKFLAVRIVSGNIQHIVDIIPLLEKGVTQPTINAIEELRRKYTIRYVLMDGEFYSSNLLVHLDKRGIIYVCRRKYSTALGNQNLPYKKAISYPMKVSNGEIQRDCFVYRFHGRKDDFYLASNMKEQAGKIRKLFRIRWRIETAFREVNRFEIKSCTRSRFIRLFFYVISCILYNIWMSIRSHIRKKVIRLNDIRYAILDFILHHSLGIRLRVLLS